MIRARSASVLVFVGLAASFAHAEPVSSVLDVRRVATVPNMGRMAVNPETGEIAFGRTGPGVNAAFAVRVLSPEGQLREVGAPIRDPDAVAWDMEGSFGPAGSIVVGSFKGLFAVTPGGHVNQFAWRGEDLVNPEDLDVTEDGALVIADFGLGRVSRLSVHGSFSELLGAPGVTRVASAREGSGLAAVTLAGAMSPGLDPGGVYSDVAFGDGSAFWGTDRYAVERDTGRLVRLLSSGNAETIATGLFDGFAADQSRGAQIGFLPTGELALGIAASGSVFTLIPAPASAALAGLGALVAIRRRRAR